jgi:hypothetical protein
MNLADVLFAPGPDPALADKLALYGRFVGRTWETEIVAHETDGKKHSGRGDITFGWILQGRAVQDVWRIHPPAMPIAGAWYGTTVRVYDPKLDAWRIHWFDPARQIFAQQIARARGNDIVQEGTYESGTATRWSFTEITESSFHWLCEVSTDGGASYRLLVEVLARR